jgi:hypothetical protein
VGSIVRTAALSFARCWSVPLNLIAALAQLLLLLLASCLEFVIVRLPRRLAVFQVHENSDDRTNDIKTVRNSR